MVNAGQCCVGATRTFVEAPIYEEMLERFRRLAEKRVVGDPFEPGVEQGPQVRVGICVLRQFDEFDCLNAYLNVLLFLLLFFFVFVLSR